MATSPESITPGRSSFVDAVNVLLTNIGEQPVDSLANQQAQEVRMAERTLREFQKDGQARAWSWNTEHCYPFDVDPSSKEITVPDSCLAFEVDPYKWNGRFMVRGKRVYDKLNRTYKVGNDTTITQLTANVVWMLSWDESPEVFNRWTTIRSARVFSTRVLGSDSITQFTAVDEQAALTELQRVEMMQSNPNALTDGPWSGPIPTYSPAFGLRRGVYGGYGLG